MTWQTITLEKACTLVTDGAHTSPPSLEEGLPMASVKDLNDWGIDISTCRRISTKDYEKLCASGCRPEIGDVLIAKDGNSCLETVCTHKQDVDLVLLSSVAILRPKPEICDSQFLKYHLSNPVSKATLMNYVSGVAIPRVVLRDFKNYSFPLPPIEVQQRISAILSIYDDLIENNRRRMALLEDAARQVYQEWFVRLRFPGYEHTRIVDGVPEGWDKVSVPEIIDVNPKEQIKSGKEICYIPMSRLSETGMTVDISDFETRTTPTAVRFRKDDVLLARITPCLENGKTAFVHFLEENEVACGSTEFIVLRGQRVSPYFTYCLARSYDFRENAIKSMVGSSGRQRVHTSCFEKFMLCLPPRLLLSHFDEAVKDCYQQIANLTRQNQKLSTARDLLLPKLMSGEIVV